MPKTKRSAKAHAMTRESPRESAPLMDSSNETTPKPPGRRGNSKRLIPDSVTTLTTGRAASPAADDLHRPPTQEDIERLQFMSEDGKRTEFDWISSFGLPANVLKNSA